MSELKALWADFTYKPHQIIGVNWMLHRETDEVKGGILCDEMGLGKTIQMLGLIKESGPGKTLLVLPLAVINQWKDTAIRARINVMVYTKQSWKLQSTPFAGSPVIYIIGYEALSNNINEISMMTFDRLVCDEAHRLGVKKIRQLLYTQKPIKKLAYNTISQIKATCKWFLTATPVVNSEDDVLSLFTLLNPSFYKLPVEVLMQTYALARSMDMLRTQIPDAPCAPIIHTHKLDFASDAERDFYVQIQTNVQKQMHYNESALAILRLILLLRQLSIHPQVYIGARQKKWKDIPNWTAPSTKFVKMKELMEAESKDEHKWIVFCHFHEEMVLMKQYLETCTFIRHIETYSGDLNAEKKEAALKKVHEPFAGGKTCDVLLVQLKAGGVGLNLQTFDRIIFNSPWWTQAAIDPGIGRAVRIGQKKQVVVHNLVLKQEEVNNVRNIDSWMEKIAAKKDIANKTILEFASH